MSYKKLTISLVVLISVRVNHTILLSAELVQFEPRLLLHVRVTREQEEQPEQHSGSSLSALQQVLERLLFVLL